MADGASHDQVAKAKREAEARTTAATLHILQPLVDAGVDDAPTIDRALAFCN